MDLLLWRHAEAFDGLPDLPRKLTNKGQKQAAAIAEWLDARLPKHTRVLVSPATRAQETAAALRRKYETVAAIAPGADPTAVLTAAGWPDAKTPVLVVGHQPTLGQVAGMLLADAPAELSIRKGAVWWLKRRTRGSDAEVVLRAVIGPDLLA
jgi:phosphohistidine phosphatase